MTDHRIEEHGLKLIGTILTLKDLDNFEQAMQILVQMIDEVLDDFKKGVVEKQVALEFIVLAHMAMSFAYNEKYSFPATGTITDESIADFLNQLQGE